MNNFSVPAAVQHPPHLREAPTNSMRYFSPPGNKVGFFVDSLHPAEYIVISPVVARVPTTK